MDQFLGTGVNPGEKRFGFLNNFFRLNGYDVYRKVNKESKLPTGFPTMNMRLPSLCMQALSLKYSTVWANRAGDQSTKQALVKTSPHERIAFPVKRKTLLNLLYSISLNLIIQGAQFIARLGVIEPAIAQ